MTIARKDIIDPEIPRFYHCITRCVRRAFLCGQDPATKKNYNHRKAWIERRLFILSDCFAIDLYAYAVMDNHYHVVLMLDPKGSEHWSDLEVVDRWLNTFDAPIKPEEREKKRQALLQNEEKIEVYRQRLCSLSWFMSCLNTPLARRSNKEDGVKGHFWESRFASIPLLDEAAVLACMAYADLNPVRARISDSLESSPFTSINKRLSDLHLNANVSLCNPIEPINGTLTLRPLTISLQDYIDFVQWTGQSIIHNNKGALEKAPPIFQKLDIKPSEWPAGIDYVGSSKRAIGSPKALDKHAETLNLQWIQGLSQARLVYR